jgi:hypothetical protein
MRTAEDAFGRMLLDRLEGAEALAEDAPRLVAELAANPLGVADDRVAAEMLEVVGLRFR